MGFEVLVSRVRRFGVFTTKGLRPGRVDASASWIDLGAHINRLSRTVITWLRMILGATMAPSL
jgi:hypothetical protein